MCDQSARTSMSRGVVLHQALRDADAIDLDQLTPEQGQAVVRVAERIIARHFDARLPLGEQQLQDFLRMVLALQPREMFYVLYLDGQMRVLSQGPVFMGTVSGAYVHPRVVVQQALACNASGCVVAHNHPSGLAEPSQADVRTTQQLRDALALVDIRLIDHFVVGRDIVSFAMRGYL